MKLSDYNIKQTLILGGSLMLSVGIISLGTIYANWQGPTAPPPGDNVPGALLNTSQTAQTKAGDLRANNLFSNNNIRLRGRLDDTGSGIGNYFVDPDAESRLKNLSLINGGNLLVNGDAILTGNVYAGRDLTLEGKGYISAVDTTRGDSLVNKDYLEQRIQDILSRIGLGILSGGHDTPVGTGLFKGNKIFIQDDNKILFSVSRRYQTLDDEGYIMRINTDGTPDASFIRSSIRYVGYFVTGLFPDGKLLNINGKEDKLERLNRDGTIDNTFEGINANSTTATAIQSDGKVIVGLAPNLLGTGNTGRPTILRLNNDGSIDNSFNTDFNTGTKIYDIEIQSDGKIIVGGEFNYNGSNIVRLNQDGSIDNSFNTGNGFNSPVFEISVYPNGKILVSGSFTSYKGVSNINRIVRLNQDGSINSIHE